MICEDSEQRREREREEKESERWIPWKVPSRSLQQGAISPVSELILDALDPLTDHQLLLTW